MIIQPRVRGFVCVTSHPVGCAAHVQEWIDYVKSKGVIAHGPKKVLVIGASTGYGLASRVTAAFGSGAATIGVFYERPSEEGRLATPGWYNSIGFTRAARAAGLYARNFNGDAFSDDIKKQVLDAIKADLGQVDLVIYSLASPRRTHPRTGTVHKSVLKPVGAPYTNKTVDTDTGIVSEITIEPATETEIADTIAVMGGEDWELWMHALRDANLLAPNAQTVAYSYIGPEVTWPVYKNGTIGLAKNDLERAAQALDALLKPTGGRAFIAVNKALVTQASSAIPVVPLYISILYKIMKARGTHERCIEQMQRLFATHMYNGQTPRFDETGRVRIDDLEMAPEVQAAVREIWPTVTTANLVERTDIAGYRSEFLRLFGFGMPGVDYQADVDPHIPMI
ncbi:enoyl-ACP reductase FabV [Opitutus terrae]|uniref:Enoyl-[acyl-carrier-protein] reductase [NADH] n=1 Tax=Opitutus terrae (strain DSM 11246 / JCM 15787 / PB90-1) TaxID=452637 RepID=FABV_OPITP|nr:enoyl-ACP reductase FabV [Opitutus terrae]B1ZZ93.1 RecName: Full=Enoyl-[acyl-carrier-protein] reductase [NADH]; Short=ENR [Opitutus terrae PB90-1]ACB77165.1 Trans-2-enoyl-CoA reductase (NAD(+)) [Opitutus terrae PB90-1]